MPTVAERRRKGRDEDLLDQLRLTLAQYPARPGSRVHIPVPRERTMATWTNGSGTTSSATTDPWVGWNTGTYECATTTTTTGTWVIWNGSVTPVLYNGNGDRWGADWPAVVEVTETPTQREAREALVRRQADEAAEFRRQQVVAREKAERLLRRHLTPEQERQWETFGWFDVMVEGGERPARHYRIERGTHGNITRLEGGRPVETLCVQPGGVPTEDANLAQMLHLLHDEEGVRRIAGIRRVA